MTEARGTPATTNDPVVAPATPIQAVELGAPPTDLGRHAVRSGLIQLSGHAALSVLTFGSAVVLARLLTPADYGLLAMAVSLTMFVGTFRDLGLPMATVHRDVLDHRHVSALFWIGLRLNILIALILLIMAPVLAWFYDQPKLTEIVPVMALGVFALGISAQHQSLLVRQMRFGRLMLIEWSAALAGIAVAIGSALAGAGYWALVLQAVVFGVVRSVALWASSGWRPARTADSLRTLPEVREMLAYGGHYTGFLVLGHLSRSLDRVLIGYFAGPAALGLYDNAHRWSHAPQHYMFPALLGVAVSGLSRKQHDPEAYRSACRKGFLPVLAILLPATAFMAVEAHDVILVLFGERWLPTVPIFRLLCIAGMVGSTGRLTSWLFLSRGETKQQFQWSLRYAPVMIAAVVVGIQWGVMGVAIGVTVATCLLAYPRIAFCLKSSPLRMRDIFGVVARPALSATAAAALLLAVRPWLSTGGAAGNLGLRLAVFSATYLGVWLVVPGGRRSARELLRIFTESSARSRTKGSRRGGGALPAAATPRSFEATD